MSDVLLIDWLLACTADSCHWRHGPPMGEGTTRKIVIWCTYFSCPCDSIRYSKQDGSIESPPDEPLGQARVPQLIASNALVMTSCDHTCKRATWKKMIERAWKQDC